MIVVVVVIVGWWCQIAFKNKLHSFARWRQSIFLHVCVCVCVRNAVECSRYLWTCCQKKILFDWLAVCFGRPLSLPALSALPPLAVHTATACLPTRPPACNNLVFIKMAINLSISNFNDFASLIPPFESKRNTNTFSLETFYSHHSLCVCCMSASHQARHFLRAISGTAVSYMTPPLTSTSTSPPSPLLPPILYLSSFFLI